ncbi:TspO/MBR family protein [Dokdonia sp. Hel_I_53]|uniref:TspO/MBR family protein n=1 Tax=Dokdonia sp. Hel_I_53 TaxID=1566287 RepID=UPI00119AE6C6|nr:TspO/MBR family protein [Dokdonia sp. Hel_I_53]TVZ52913.1 TspO/MBR related protein [Dokdonia sp. Hel_I_53]
MSKDFLIRIILSVAICLLVGVLGALATQTTIDTWFLGLNKPVWSPPNWVFGPVWITLYIMMGVAAAIVWNKGFYHKWVKIAMYHFGFQLILNALWSIIFFGFQEPFLALLDIIGLLILLIFTIKWFKVVDKWAALLLVPYLLWIILATALNFEIWRLN